MVGRYLGMCFGVVFLSSCSLLLDKRVDQCSRDEDCKVFARARCDLAARLCIAETTNEGDEDGGPLEPGDGSSEGAAGHGGLGEGGIDAGSDGGAPGADACAAPSGCFTCKPTNDVQFENACTTAHCRHFDNRTRLKNLVDGGLRPLPLSN
jgi:hypothetical protein